MAISDSHFKTPEITSVPGKSLDLPMEMIGVAGGVLLVFAIIMLVIWKRMNRATEVDG